MSIELKQDVSLQALNTLAITPQADYLIELTQVSDLPAVFAYAEQLQRPLWVLGGGSNLVLAGDLPYLVLKVATRGIEVLEETDTGITLKVQAGENWHELVRWTVKQGYQGLENLSLIPGTVGAAPVQNIGAYGVELKDYLLELTAVNLQTQQVQVFSQAQCQFAYRDSRFKREPDQWLILDVTLKLAKQPQLVLNYGNIQALLAAKGIEQPTPLIVSDLVCEIRRSKLPDPQVLPNTGSFFKNPEVSQAHAEQLRGRYPSVVSFPLANGQVKLAAGWLIEQAGWKGKQVGDAAVHQQQALVLVNKGQATGVEVLELARQIAADIQQQFAVSLEIEPNILPRGGSQQ